MPLTRSLSFAVFSSFRARLLCAIACHSPTHSTILSLFGSLRQLACSPVCVYVDHLELRWLSGWPERTNERTDERTNERTTLDGCECLCMYVHTLWQSGGTPQAAADALPFKLTPHPLLSLAAKNRPGHFRASLQSLQTREFATLLALS